jgi:hypothetical protein
MRIGAYGTKVNQSTLSKLRRPKKNRWLKENVNLLFEIMLDEKLVELITSQKKLIIKKAQGAYKKISIHFLSAAFLTHCSWLERWIELELVGSVSTLARRRLFPLTPKISIRLVLITQDDTFWQ